MGVQIDKLSSHSVAVLVVSVLNDCNKNNKKNCLRFGITPKIKKITPALKGVF
jgi:hypothetical protein